MAWQTEMLIKLRGYINDFDVDNQKYTDEALKRFILLALDFMQLEFCLRMGPYQVDFINETITPDPTLPESRDNDCVGLTILKAGALIMKTEARIGGGQGTSVSIVDEMAKWEIKRDVKTMLDLSNGYAEEYNLAKLVYMRGVNVFGVSVHYCHNYFWWDNDWYENHYHSYYGGHY